MSKPIKWDLVSGFVESVEMLVLKRNGETVFEYAPGKAPYNDVWHVYSNGFPLKEFVSRDACLRHAQTHAGQMLIVRNFHRME